MDLSKHSKHSSSPPRPNRGRQHAFDLLPNGGILAKEDSGILGEKTYGLAVIGEIDGYNSPFDALKDIIMMSPMTSVILISDLSEREVHEKAEGYGIIGHVKRTIPRDDIFLLLEQFEKILAVIPPSME